jgi:hypothetical protein
MFSNSHTHNISVSHIGHHSGNLRGVCEDADWHLFSICLAACLPVCLTAIATDIDSQITEAPDILTYYLRLQIIKQQRMPLLFGNKKNLPTCTGITCRPSTLPT